MEARTGYDIENVYDDFYGSLLDDESENMIWAAKRG
jgi:hypothetical protein